MRSLLVALLLITACGRTTPYEPRVPPVVPPPPVVPNCSLALLTPLLDFGLLAPMETGVRDITLRNVGRATCVVDIAQLISGAADFSFVTPPIQGFTLDQGTEVRLPVKFAPGAAALPKLRSGLISLATNDPLHPKLLVDLRGSLKLCELQVAPSSIDFGNVTLNGNALGHLALTNAGTAACAVSSIAFGPSTDSNFVFPMVPGKPALPPGATVSVALQFNANTSAPPYQKTGSVQVDSNDLTHPRVVVPLSGFVSTICTEAGQYIYLVDSSGQFSRFDPTTLTSLDIATLNCPTGANPFSMNVDQSGIAWIIFDDGDLFRVETSTGACTAAMYQPNQQGFTTYGMGSVFDSSTGLDTLYLSAGNFNGTSSKLGTLSFPGLKVTSVAVVPLGWLELAGTGDGQLWAYAPNGSVSGGPLLARLNRTNGMVIDRYNVPEITTVGGFAVKFFGGAFYVFVGPDVWKVDRSALMPGETSPRIPAKKVLSVAGRDVVGAGVSTCAPVQN